MFTLQIVVMALYIWRKNPELFVARSKMQKGTKGWDRVLFYVLQALILAIFPVAGLDHWSAAPLWVIVLGYVLLTVGMAGTAWVMSVNKFAEMSVRIQTERGHQVVDTGPYAFVRHPFYVATFPAVWRHAAGLGIVLGVDSSRRGRDRSRRADGLGRPGASQRVAGIQRIRRSSSIPADPRRVVGNAAQVWPLDPNYSPRSRAMASASISAMRAARVACRRRCCSTAFSISPGSG